MMILACGRGEVHSEFNQEDTILSCFSLVVCRHPLTGAFLVVQEFANSGFWLPGGTPLFTLLN